MSNEQDRVEFDDDLVVALARSVERPDVVPHPDVKRRLFERLSAPPVPKGFSFRYAAEPDWVHHPVPGILMKVLALNPASGYATLLLDVAPGTRFPAHDHYGGAEECYVLSGTLYTCDRRLGPGDFIHADAGTEHGELWTDEGCRVLLVVPPEDYFPAPPPSAA